MATPAGSLVATKIMGSLLLFESKNQHYYFILRFKPNFSLLGLKLSLALQETVASILLKCVCVYIYMMYPQIYLFTYFAINNSFLKYLSSEMSEDKEVLIKDPENAKLTGAVIQSFYKDV